MEQRLEIDEHGMLAGRDQILEMKVRRSKDIEEGQKSPLPLIEPVHLFRGGTGTRLDELHPAIVRAAEDANRPKVISGHQAIEPGQQLLKMEVDGQRSRLVNDRRSRREAKQGDAPAVAVRVSGVHVDLGHDSRLARQEPATLDLF